MSDKQIFRLVHQQARDNACKAIGYAQDGYVVTVTEPTRTLEQNSALWPLLGEISKQVKWHGVKLTSEEWKEVFSAILHGQKSVPNLEGTGFIILGRPTSKMGKKEFSDLLTLAQAFAAERGVVCAA